MSGTDFEERERIKRVVSAAISKPREDEEEFEKFLNELSSYAYMNRKGLDPFCDFYNWPHQAKEPEVVEIHVIPSGLMPPKATILRTTKPGFAGKTGYGIVKMKPGFAAKDPYTLKDVPDFKPSAIVYRHSRSQPKYGVIGRDVIRAEHEKASRSYLTPEMNSFLDAINKSRSLLELEDDWDGEGSVGYEESTWIRTRDFLVRNAIRLHHSKKKLFDPPEFEPGPNGSIDLHWKTDARELLINVPADPHDTISFYGDDRVEDTENAIRGKNIEDSTNTEWIFLWLTQ